MSLKVIPHLSLWIHTYGNTHTLKASPKSLDYPQVLHISDLIFRGAVPEKETLEDFKDLENKGTYEGTTRTCQESLSLKNAYEHIIFSFSDQIKRYKPHRSEVSNRKYKVSGARTYFYEGEASCEKNMETFLRCIEAVADSTHGTGFSAIKVTALGRPSLLVNNLRQRAWICIYSRSTSELVWYYYWQCFQLQLSEVIVRARRFYQNVSGHDGFVIEGKVSKEAFEQRFKQKVNYDTYEPEVQDWLGNMTFDKKG